MIWCMSTKEVRRQKEGGRRWEALGGGGGSGEGGGAVAASPVMSCVSVSRCQEPRSGLPPGHCCRPKCCLRRFHPKKLPGTTPPPKAPANMSSGGVENRGNCRGGGGVCVRCRLIFFFELYFCSDGEAAEEQQRNYSGTNKQKTELKGGKLGAKYQHVQEQMTLQNKSVLSFLPRDSCSSMFFSLMLVLILLC